MESTPYFTYIALAYGVTLGALTIFFGVCLFRWKRTAQALKNIPHET